jgi:hypothetical protein
MLPLLSYLLIHLLIRPINSENQDKLLLLNDLSLEQAYLHHSGAGILPSSATPSASLAQQAARLAAGSYADSTGQAPGGWKVWQIYQNLNSLAVISVREDGECAIAFRGSDDRLDWRNDYRARPLPLLLCETDVPGETYFLDFTALATPSSVKEEAQEVQVQPQQQEMRERWQQQRQRGRRGRQPQGRSKQEEETPSSSNITITITNDSTTTPIPLPTFSARYCPHRRGIYTLHYGFYQSFRLLTSGTTLAEDWRHLMANGTCNPARSLLTGHSLGGSFVIYAKILGWPGVPVTFAAPRSVTEGSCPRSSSSGSSQGESTTKSAVGLSVPITRIYLEDDPVPARLPVSDALRLVGGSGGGGGGERDEEAVVGKPWIHCGCAVALQPVITVANGEEAEHFAAKSMGCGSNEPLMGKDQNTMPLPGLPGLPPPTVVLPSLPPPPLRGKNKRGRNRGEEKQVEEEQEQETTTLLAPADLMRHIHTRYVRAVDEACQGPLDSMMCLFDHEA